MKTIKAKTDAEFTSLVEAAVLLAESPLKRERGDQKFEAIAFERWSCDPEARSLSFEANQHALEAVGVGIPNTATDVIELANFLGL
ncbi:hypothetical protein [Comamonas testosteroni]|uniref:Uncharacterized protein n=1 Tax=Comamonas testosteroni TaxID=285 RepID=A0A096FKE7_COMTE|nr:hypothetical protein [Comamonas testosteroni]KGH30841.1 hypothetical protein P353_08245 [Comamonas testosteroni]